MPEIKQILFDQEAITSKVAELAEHISADYTGKELVVVCILKAAVMFTSDLMRGLSVSATLEFIQASSYGMSSSASRDVVITQDLKKDIRNRHVLLVDTIIDTGNTLHALLDLLSKRNPASLQIAVLLDKESRRLIDVPVAYRGFRIPDVFVAGYGMDYQEYYRSLPYIAAIE